MNVLSVSECSLIQNENNIINPIGPKTLEMNNSSNEYVPDVIGNNDPQKIYLNNCTLVISITVTDADEVNGTIGASEPMNGSHISYVSVNLTAFYYGSSNLAMVYNASASASLGYNTTRSEGIWEYAISLQSIPAGNYTVNFSALDNGNSKGSFKLSNNTEYLLIRIGQFNRAPVYYGPSSLPFILYEDHHNIVPYEIDLTTLFYDADVADGPFTNTQVDSLVYKVWSGTTWALTGICSFPNFQIQFNSTEGLWIKTNPNGYNINDVIINLSAWDSYGKMVERQITVKIESINDPPELETTDKWEYYNTNARSAGPFIIDCTQDKHVSLRIKASDIETDSLMFNVEDFDLSNIHISNSEFVSNFKIGSSTGELNFTPTNNWVGIFDVNITVNDTQDQDYKIFTFNVNNKNDNPTLTRVSYFSEQNETVKISDHSVKLGDVFFPAAVEGQRFYFTVIANDPDIDIGIDDTLYFEAESEEFNFISEGKSGSSGYKFSFTPTNVHALKGYVHMNITVKDHIGSKVDDWVNIKIAVKNVNDAPEIIWVDGIAPLPSKFWDRGVIQVGTNVDVTIEAIDVDDSDLFCDVDNSKVYIFPIAYKGWRINFKPLKSDIGNFIINITILDHGYPPLIDWIELQWTVVDNKNGPPPDFDITTNDPYQCYLGDDIDIKGTWSEPAYNKIQIYLKIIYPDGNESDYFLLPEDNKLPPYHVIISSDGTWKFILDYSWRTENLTSGTHIFTFKALDSKGFEIRSESITIDLYDKPEPTATNDGEDEDNNRPHVSDGGSSGFRSDMDFLIYYLIIPFTAVILIIGIVMVVVLRKKRMIALESQAFTQKVDSVPTKRKQDQSQKHSAHLRHKNTKDFKNTKVYFCENCRARVSTDSWYCDSCGASIHRPEVELFTPPELNKKKLLRKDKY